MFLSSLLSLILSSSLSSSLSFLSSSLSFFQLYFCLFFLHSCLRHPVFVTDVISFLFNSTCFYNKDTNTLQITSVQLQPYKNHTLFSLWIISQPFPTTSLNANYKKYCFIIRSASSILKGCFCVSYVRINSTDGMIPFSQYIFIFLQACFIYSVLSIMPKCSQ